MYYKVTLYNLKKNEILCWLPERRTDARKPKNVHGSVCNWLRHIYGKEWFQKNYKNIGITEVEDSQMPKSTKILPIQVIYSNI